MQGQTKPIHDHRNEVQPRQAHHNLKPALRSPLHKNDLFREIKLRHKQILERLEVAEYCEPWTRNQHLCDFSEDLRTFMECQEAALYPMCRERHELAYLVDDARGDQHYISQCLRELEGKRPDEVSWEETFERLRAAVCEYIAYEAGELLPRAWEVLDANTLSAIQMRFAGRRQALSRRRHRSGVYARRSRP